jgi:hypothetical protein
LSSYVTSSIAGDFRGIMESMSVTRREFLAASCTLPVAASLSPTAAAADSWLTRPPDQWEPSDVLAILNKSAWTKTVYPELTSAWINSGRSEGKTNPAAEGLRDKRTMSEFGILVRWESALPIRLARKQPPEPLPNPPQYVLSLSRIPTAFITAAFQKTSGDAYSVGKIAADVAQSAALQCEDKEPIAASRAVWTESEFERRIEIGFPIGNKPFALEDRVVSFSAQAGPLLLRAIFPLSRMVFHSRLEL